jgi:hypothetical protein
LSMMNLVKYLLKTLFFASVCSLQAALPVAAQTASLPRFGHVVIVVEENHGYSQVTGSSMPYLSSLISQYGLAMNYVADTHPSIGNYFVLTTGQILINDDSQTPSSFPVSADNIVREMIKAGITWKSYAEDLPYAGYTGGNSGNYYVRHNPLVYLTDVNTSSTQLRNIVPFTQFATDLADGNLPQYSFVVPNACDNAHNCPLSTADTWLENNIDPLIKSALFQKDGLLIIVFDENSNTDGTGCTDTMIQSGTWCGGQVPAVLVSPLLVSTGFKSSKSYHHENVLRLMAEGLGLTTFPGASANADNMVEFFSSGSNSGPQFTLAAQTDSQTVDVGATASYTLQVTPKSGFNKEVTFACSGTPKGAACTFQPSSVTLDGTNKASVAMNVTTTAGALTGPAGTRQVPPVPFSLAPLIAWMGLLFLAATIAIVRIEERDGVPHGWCGRLAALLLLAACFTGCSGAVVAPTSTQNNSNATPAGTYILTVMATSGSLSASTQVTLKVQ